MAWVILLFAGLFEIMWAVGLKFTEGFTRPWPSVWVAIAMVMSVVLLAQALRFIPMSTAYVVWTGIGAAGTALIGILFLKEATDLPRVLCLLMIIAGVVGLKMFSPA